MLIPVASWQPANYSRRFAVRSSNCIFVLVIAILACCKAALANDASNAFFESLGQLCGARFEGVTTLPTSGQDDFAGKLLVAEFQSCTTSEIRIPFAVGENTSRTWIISRTAGGLQLQHDHRHPDGTEDEISMYGGESLPDGRATGQSFAADAHTKQLIPDAATNVWTISLKDESGTLVYALQRHGKPRFTAELKRVDSLDSELKP